MLAWLRDPEVRDNVGLRSEPSLERTLTWIGQAHDDPAIEARTILVDGQHVGNVVLDHIDHDLARLSVYVGEGRGQGVGRQAVRLMLGVAFDDLRLRKVYLTVHVRNTRAIATYVACGFAVEGVHRQEFTLRGERIDELYMGILRTEYERLPSEASVWDVLVPSG